MNRRGWRFAGETGPSTQRRHVAYAVMSALLRYPDEGLVHDVPLLASAVESVPASIGDPLRRLISHIADSPLLDLQTAYVATFDLQRKCCLYLTYYLSGDTRRRGEALWRFQDACRRAGFHVADGELPDFLPVLLELAARGGEAVAIELMQENREGIQMLGAALRARRSPYADLVSALDVLLPAARSGAAVNAIRLAREGPPSELVGLESARTIAPYRADAPTAFGSERL